MTILIADIILYIHFVIALFYIVGLFAPFSNIFKIAFLKNYHFRIFHLILIIFVFIETLIGITCPLTILENSLRNSLDSDSFSSYLIKKLLFWDLPIYFFLFVYFICFLWTIFIWFNYPPSKIKK